MEFDGSDFVACAHAPWLRRWSELLQPATTSSSTTPCFNDYDAVAVTSGCSWPALYSETSGQRWRATIRLEHAAFGNTWDDPGV